jgi:glycosyltransferase involved in cell wall biosynthesis
MAHALQRQGCEISFFLRLKKEKAALVYLKNKMATVLAGRHIIPECDPKIVSHYPKQVNAMVGRHSIHAVLGTSSFYMHNETCPVPSVFWGDTTVAGVVNSYPYYTRLTKDSIKDCHSLEQAALNSITLAVFSNHWAADVARENYTFDERKIRVIPYGANLLHKLEADDIAECIERRDANELELLFVGGDWQRKGAQIAVDAATVLRARGINVRLTLVGCTPPRSVSVPEYVTIVGRIDKTTSRGQALLSSLYMQSHLLLLPSRAECAAVSLSEASAHGVPSLSTDVGGNRTLIQDGVNGYLLPLEAGPTDYAEYVVKMLSDSSKYCSMCWSSFERFQAELNWDVAVSRLLSEIASIVEPKDEEYACSRAS